MAINWGALIPAAARGLGAYRAGQYQGEQERRRDDEAARTSAFEEWAKRRAMQLQEDKTSALYQSQEATRQNNAAMLMERLKNAVDIADRNNATKRETTGLTTDARRDVAGMQYGEGGAVDRTNASRENQVRITVDGANRRDDVIVQLPDGGFGRVDATGRVVPMPGAPYEKALSTRAGGGAGGMTPAQRNMEVHRMKSQFRQEGPVKDAYAIAGPIRQIEASLSLSSPQSQLSAVYETLKMFDPKTGVRPGEMEVFGNAASLPERGRRLLQQWNSGKQLTPQMVADIKALVAEKRAAASAPVKPVQQAFGDRLRRLGLEADSAYVAPSPIPDETPEQRRERLRRGG